jgi:hypothetical protein
VPSTVDLDGTGRASLVIWRATTDTYYWLTPSSGYNYQAAGAKTWGSPTDIPMSK